MSALDYELHRIAPRNDQERKEKRAAFAELAALRKVAEEARKLLNAGQTIPYLFINQLDAALEELDALK